MAEAIESILGQDFSDFELLISDNASTDGTEAICRKFADQDDRIRYIRSGRNNGAAWNFNNCVWQSNSEYFKWIADDDLYLPSYLSRCIDVLERRPDVVLCHTKTIDIDERGEPIHYWDVPSIGIHPDPVERLRRYLNQQLGYFEVLGVVRRRVLLSTPLIAGYSGSDVPLLAELLLRGRFEEVPEFLFLHREHPGRSVRAYADQRTRREWFDPTKHAGTTATACRIAAETVRVVAGAPVTPATRRALVRVVAAWIWKHRKSLAREAVVVSSERLRRTVPTPVHQTSRALGHRVDNLLNDIASTPIAGATQPGPDRPAVTLNMDEPRRREPELVSVVVLARNAATTLGAQLQALSSQEYAATWEVLVLDHASVDETRMLAYGWRHRLPALDVLEVDGTTSLSRACNQAADAAKGELLLFCDARDAVGPGWLAAMVDAARDSDIVGGPFYETDLTGSLVERQGTAEPLAVPFLPWAVVRNVGVWADVLESVGGWPEQSGGWDIGFCWMAQLQGYRFAAAPQAVVDYRQRRSLLGAVAERYRFGITGAQLHRDFSAEGAPRALLWPGRGRWRWIVTRAPLLWPTVASRRRWALVTAEAVGNAIGHWRVRRRGETSDSEQA